VIKKQDTRTHHEQFINAKLQAFLSFDPKTTHIKTPKNPFDGPRAIVGQPQEKHPEECLTLKNT